MRPNLGSALALWGVLLMSCIYPADRGRALETRVDKLTTDNEQLRRDLDETRQKLAATEPKIDVKIAEVEKALDSLDKASRRTGADTSVQLQKTVEDVAQLRGQVETYVYKISELEKALAKSSEDTEKRLVEMRGSEAVKAAEAKRKAEELKRPDSKKEFLQLADDKAKAGDTALARELYTEFLKKWPKEDLAGEAHFGLGETWFTEDKCREALFEYGKVIQEHAKARSAPSAYLRSSECFRKLKMTDESRLALEEVVKQFPKSEAAKTAKTRLAELDKEKTKKPDTKKPDAPKGKTK